MVVDLVNRFLFIDLEVSIGVESKDLHKMSHLTNPSFLEYARDIIMDPRILFMFLVEYIQPEHAPIHKIQKNPDWLPLDRVTSSSISNHFLGTSGFQYPSNSTIESFGCHWYGYSPRPSQTLHARTRRANNQ